MNDKARVLLVTLSALTLVGCKKTVTQSPHHVEIKQQSIDRISGPFGAVDIVWEEVDLK